MNKLKITFVAFGYEHLAISLLSAIAKREGHKTFLAFSSSIFNDRFMSQSSWLSKPFNDHYQIMESIKKQQPDVVAFSSVTSTFLQLLEVAKEVKKYNPNIKTIFGGVHPSAVPDRVITQESIDYIVIGEGEEAFVKILEAIADNNTSPIVNTWFKTKDGQIIKGFQKGFLQDLNTLPQFDKPLWEEYIRLGDLYVTMTSRGCPFKCAFCFNNYFKHLPEETPGKYVRQRSVEHVMEELLFAKKRYKIKWIDFLDDILTFDKVWLKEFLIRYRKEINVPFHCFTHPKYFDEEIAQWLSEAGCKWAQMGVQTLDENYKKQELHRNESNEDIVKALDLMKKYKINSKVDYILGLPGEPKQAQDTALEFFKCHTPTLIETYWTSYFPKTELMDKAIQSGLLNSEQVEDICEGRELNLYRKSDNLQDKEHIGFYHTYHFLFKLLPNLPKAIRNKVSYNKYHKVPSGIKGGLAFASHLFISFTHSDPRIANLIKHVFFQMYRIIITKTRLGKPKAIKS